MSREERRKIQLQKAKLLALERKQIPIAPAQSTSARPKAFVGAWLWKLAIHAILVVVVEESVKRFVPGLLHIAWVAILATLTGELIYKTERGRSLCFQPRLNDRGPVVAYAFRGAIGAMVVTIYWFSIGFMIQQAESKIASSESHDQAKAAASGGVPKSLEGEDRKQFIEILRHQAEPRDSIQFACAKWNESACAKAGAYLAAFSEASWPLASEVVNRLELAVPLGGVVLVSKSQAPPGTHLPPHMGWWSKMDASQQTIWAGFSHMGIALSQQGTEEVSREDYLILYFGPDGAR